MKGSCCLARVLWIAGKQRTKFSAQASCEAGAPTNRKRRARNRIQSSTSPRAFLRIFELRLSAIHPLVPTNCSQSESGVSGSKWSLWSSMLRFASRSVPRKVFPARSRSTKKVISGGSFVDDRPFDFLRCEVVIRRDIANLFPRVYAICKRLCGNTPANKNGSAK